MSDVKIRRSSEILLSIKSLEAGRKVIAGDPRIKPIAPKRKRGRRRQSPSGWRFYDLLFYRTNPSQEFAVPDDFIGLANINIGDSPCAFFFDYPIYLPDYTQRLGDFSDTFTRETASRWKEITPAASLKIIAYLTNGDSLPFNEVATYGAGGWTIREEFYSTLDTIRFIFSRPRSPSDSTDEDIEIGLVSRWVRNSPSDTEFQLLDWSTGGQILLLTPALIIRGAGTQQTFSGSTVTTIYSEYQPRWPTFPRELIYDTNHPQFNLSIKEIFDNIPGALAYETRTVFDTMTGVSDCQSGGFISAAAANYIPLPAPGADGFGVVLPAGGNIRYYL